MTAPTNFTTSGGHFTLLGANNGDLARFVGSGLVQLAVVGLDKLYEYNAQTDNKLGVIVTMPNMGFGRLSFLTKDPNQPIKEVITPYPYIASMICQRIGKEMDIYPCSGKSEMIVRRGGAQATLDFVDTGVTFSANGLIELPTGLSSCLTFATRLPSKEPDRELFWPETLKILQKTLQNRKVNPTGTIASQLVASKNEASKKVISEAGELLMSISEQSSERVVSESADLLFAINALLVQRNCSMFDVLRELRNRMK